MIPLILVALILYTQKAPSITGAQTAEVKQEDKSNILGTYSIMPSFKAKADYTMSADYQTLKETLGIIVNNCKASENMEQCFKDNANDYNWNCDDLRDEAQEILYDFIDKLNDCAGLKENNVACRFSLDDRSISILPNSFDITLTNDAGKIQVKIKRLGQDTKNTKEFYDYLNIGSLGYTDYDNKDKSSENLNPVTFIVDYASRTPVISQSFGIDSSSRRVPLSSDILYKVNNNVYFVEPKGKSFEGPGSKVIDIPTSKSFRFCAKSPSGAKVYAYDDYDQSVKLRDIVYRFSVVYPK